MKFAQVGGGLISGLLPARLKKAVNAMDSNAVHFYQNIATLELLPITERKKHYLALEKDSNWQVAHGYDTKLYLPNEVLYSADRMCMAHSMELRVPFLDEVMKARARSFTPEQHLIKGTKTFIRQYLNKRGHKEIVNRQKEGFGMPLLHWLRNDLAYRLEGLNDAHSPLYTYFSKSKVKRIIKAHLNSQQKFSQELWALLVLDAWLKKHL